MEKAILEGKEEEEGEMVEENEKKKDERQKKGKGLDTRGQMRREDSYFFKAC